MFFMQEILRHHPQPTAYQPLQYICAAAAAEYAGLETHELKHCPFGIWVKAHLLCVSQSSPFFGSSAAAASSDCPFVDGEICRSSSFLVYCEDTVTVDGRNIPAFDSSDALAIAFNKP